MTASETAQQKLALNYEAHGGENGGTIPWAEILNMLMQWLGTCLPAMARRNAINHPKATKASLQARLEGMDIDGLDVDLATDSCYATICATPVPDIKAAQAEYLAAARTDGRIVAA